MTGLSNDAPGSFRRELGIAFLVGATVWAATMVPYLLGHLTAPPGKVFNGFFYIADDAATYVSKMREGADGAWGWTDRYISSPRPAPVLLFSFYIVSGKLAALLHLPLLAAYHLARLSGAVALVAAARSLSRATLADRRARHVALALVLLGSGLGYAVTLAHQPRILGETLEALDLHLPEISGLYSILAIPHFAWSAALMAWAIAGILRITHRPTPSRAAWLGLTLLALCLVHPQMLFVLGMLAAVHLVMAKGRPASWALVATAFAVNLPLLGYYIVILANDEVVRAWSRQWHHQAPGPLSMLLALGIPLALAVMGAIRGAERRQPAFRLMSIWVVLIFALLYIPNPVNIQRRLLDGLYIPIAILAAAGLAAIGAKEKRPRRELVAVGASAISSSLVLLLGISWSLSHQDFIYLDAETVSAAAWLGGQPHDPCLPPAVLAHPSTGLQVPPLAGYRVYAGHYSETLDYQDRAHAGLAALRLGGADLARFMTANDIALAWIGPAERAAGAGDPGPGFSAVKRAGSTTIYRVDGAIPTVPTRSAGFLSGPCTPIVEPVPAGG